MTTSVRDLAGYRTPPTEIRAETGRTEQRLVGHDALCGHISTVSSSSKQRTAVANGLRALLLSQEDR